MAQDIDYSIHYKRWHDGSLDNYINQAKTYNRLLEKLLSNIPREAKILDYGCGAGLLVYYLKQQFSDVLGVDASIQQIEVAKSHNLPVSHLPVSAFSDWTKSQTQTFDVIFLFDVLEHIPANEQIIFMRNLVNTLKQNGKIFIKVPNANSLLASRWRYIDWTHLSSFTECSLDFVCLNSGLKDITYFDDETSFMPRYPWIPRWSLRGFYLKMIIRYIWRLYIKSEIGKDEKNVKLGLNLFACATKA